MFTLNPYINLLGTTEEAFNFYKSVFGGEFTMLQRFKDTPNGEKMSPEDQQKIMHVSLPVGKGNVLMGTDAIASMGDPLVMGNNVSLSLNTETEEETTKLFNALAVGGTVIVPLEKMFWGAYFGMLTDKFGIKWMVNCDLSEKK